MTPRFDPTRALIFDLARGQLRDEEGTARLNLPASLVLRLCEQAGSEATLDFARSIGSELGRRIADRLKDSTSEASVETWVEHLGGQLALVGLGELSVERWGKALVLRVSGASSEVHSLLPGVLASALQRALGRQLELVLFEGQEGLGFLALSGASAARAIALKDGGAGLGQVIEQLHQGDA